MRCFLLKYRRLHAVPFSGIDHGACGIGICLGHILYLFAILRYDLYDRNIELCGKFKVSVIMRRHAHYGSGTVVGKYIIRKPYGYLCTIKRICRIGSREYTRLFLILQSIHIALICSIVYIVSDCLSCLIRRESCSHLMLRREHHEGGTVKSIGSCGIYGDALALASSLVYREINLRTV